MTGVTTCTINGDGSLSACSKNAGSGTAGIVAGASYAYVSGGGSTVNVCAIGAGGALSSCAATGSGFSSADGMSLAGGYAYVSNQANGTVSACTINVDGTLSGCAASSVGGAPTDVVINGSYAYVDDRYGNIFLCTVGSGGALTNCAVSNGGTAFNLGIQLAIH